VLRRTYDGNVIKLVAPFPISYTQDWSFVSIFETEDYVLFIDNRSPNFARLAKSVFLPPSAEAPSVPPQTSPQASPSYDLIINENVTTIAVFDLSNEISVLIIGDYTQSSNGTLIIAQSTVITIQGCARLNGTLRVEIDPNQATNGSQSNVIFFNPSCSSGQFNSVEVFYTTPLSSSSDGCTVSTTKATPSYQSDRLTLLFTVESDSSQCDEESKPPSVDTGVLVGAIVGSIVGAAIIITIVLLAIPKTRAKLFPFQNRNTKPRNGSEL